MSHETMMQVGQVVELNRTTREDLMLAVNNHIVARDLDASQSTSANLEELRATETMETMLGLLQTRAALDALLASQPVKK